MGRPPQESLESKKIAREDERDRVAIEGKFGQGKRRFTLGLIMSKGPDTSACSIVMSFLVMNLMKWLKVIFYVLFFWQSGKTDTFGKAFLAAQARLENGFMLWMTERPGNVAVR